MGGTYQAGEEKVRPGVYRRYTTQDKKLVAGAMTCLLYTSPSPRDA